MKEKGVKAPTPQRLKELKQLGYTQKDIATFYKVSERTVRYWKKDDGKPKKWLRGRKMKIDDGDDANAFIFYICFKLKHSTQQEMAYYFFRLSGVKVSRFAISRVLKILGITRKKASYQYTERLNYKERMKDFKKIIPSLPQPFILALDECSFHLNEVPRYGYAFTSSRVNSQKPGKKGSNHTLILCIQNVNGKGVVHWELIEGGMKTENFHDFITNLKLPTNEKYYLIMDNLPVHKAKQSCIKLGLTPIKELLESKNIGVIFLPPYIPQLNPVELCFNFIRHYVEKNKPRTYEELKLTIAKIMNMLNQKDLTKYFCHCSEHDLMNENSLETPHQQESSNLKSGSYFRTL